MTIVWNPKLRIKHCRGLKLPLPPAPAWDVVLTGSWERKKKGQFGCKEYTRWALFFIFYFFLRESFNLWRSLLMIAFYRQTKTPISFWYRRRLNPRSLIQPSETLPVELTEIHNSLSSICFLIRWPIKKKKVKWNGAFILMHLS